jgi:DNA polymerase-3 subunit gamma/tau
MSQALYRKWRPQQWDQVVGQEHVVQTLRNALAGDKIAHAYLFAGPRGTGKTTTARLLAKTVNCTAPDLAVRPCDECECCLALNQGRFLDLIEIDAASNTSVDDVRSLREKINFSPNLGKYKVYIIDEVHMLSTAAFNALLKTLEEPPAHAIFILATTEVHKIPATVLSRCQRHEFRRIPVNVMVRLLRELADSEGMQVEPEALTLIARQATGSLRDAISLLDQLASTGELVTTDLAHSVLGTAASQSVLEVVDALLNKDSATGLDLIHAALDSGSDPRQFARMLVEYLRTILLTLMKSADQVDASAETRAARAAHAQKFSLPELLHTIRVFNHAVSEARLSFQPALPLELAFIECVEGDQSQQGQQASADPLPKRRVPKSTGYSGSTAGEKVSPDPSMAGSTPALAAPESVASDLPNEGEVVDMEKIRQSWARIVALLRQRNPHTQALFNSCKPLGFKDGCLILGSSDFVKANLEKPEHIQLAEQALVEVLGVQLPLRCVVASGKRGAPPDVDSDGIVATALRDLGGEVVDVQ